MNFNMKEQSKFRLMVQSDLIWKTKMFMVNNLGKVLAKTIFACIDWTGHHQIGNIALRQCANFIDRQTRLQYLSRNVTCAQALMQLFLLYLHLICKISNHDFINKKVKRDSGHNWNIGQLRHKPAITNCLLQANKKLVCF